MRSATCGGIAIFSICLVTAAVADAGEARKCSDRDGRSSYVSGACPAGTREIWVREFEPEPIDAAVAQKRRIEHEGRPSRAHGQGYRRPQRDSKRNRADRACETAKRHRDQVRDRDWYTLTLEQLRALDDKVARSCG